MSSSDTDREGDMLRRGGKRLRLDKLQMRRFSATNIRDIVTMDGQPLEFIRNNGVNMLSGYEVKKTYSIQMTIATDAGDVHVMFDKAGMTVLHREFHRYVPYREQGNLDLALNKCVEELMQSSAQMRF